MLSKPQRASRRTEEESGSTPIAGLQLLAAEAYNAEGWRVRGHGGGSSVGKADREAFREYQEQARDTLIQITQADPTNPTPWALLTATYRNLAASEQEKLSAARAALAIDPEHFAAVRYLLDGLAPHWHDDEEAGLRIARELARNAPRGSLVAGCVILAYVGKWHHAYYFGEGDAAFSEVLRQPEVQQEVAAAFTEGMRHAECEWSVEWLTDAAALLARAGMRDLAASAFQRLGERASTSGNPWIYISKTAKLPKSGAFAALRDWALRGTKHPCKDVQDT